MKLQRFVFTFVATLFIVSPVWAFDTRTHVYVGQQVINDLQRQGAQWGTVSISPFGDFLVAPEIRDAILAYPSVFRAGNVGPDAFPDVVGGQVTTHPGLIGRMQTDDWLKFVMKRAKSEAAGSERSKALAFAQGYLSHAAADMFAHTYVNWYAGDSFELFDADNLNVEFRHMVLEKYIAEHQPSLGASPQSLIATGNNLPVNFLTNTFIRNSVVKGEYAASGAGIHLEYMYRIEDGLQRLIDDIDNLPVFAVLKWLGELSAAAAEAGVTSYISPVKVVAGSAEEIAELCTTVLSVADRVPETMFAQFNANDERFAESSINIKSSYRGDNLSRRALPFHKVTGAVGNIVSGGVIGGLVGGGAGSIVVGTIVGGDTVVDTLVGAGEAIIDETTTVLDKIVDAGIDVAVFVADTLVNICEDTSNAAQKLNEAVSEVPGLTANEVQRLVDGRAIVDLLSSIATSWLRDVRRTNEEYIRTSSRVATNIMDPNGDPWGEFRYFVDCHAAAYMGIPSVITDTGCQVRNFADELLSKFDVLIKILLLPNTIYQEKVVQPIQERLAKKLIQALDAQEFLDLIDFATQPGTAQNLTKTYQLTGGSVRLLPISDIVARVNADMGVTANQKFNPSEFNVVHNAIVLAKLSLLDEVQLNELTNRAGVQHTQYPQRMLFNRDAGMFNVLFDGVRSIDGNHSWMSIAPPYPRQMGYADPSPDSERSFGYANNGVTGFRLWMEPNAREKIFMRIFNGPISPGIEFPSYIGLTELLPSNYDERNCLANPFPVDTSYQRCGPIIGWLIPILNLLQ